MKTIDMALSIIALVFLALLADNLSQNSIAICIACRAFLTCQLALIAYVVIRTIKTKSLNPAIKDSRG